MVAGRHGAPGAIVASPAARVTHPGLAPATIRCRPTGETTARGMHRFSPDT